jgi:hypothetical protein
LAPNVGITIADHYTRNFAGRVLPYLHRMERVGDRNDPQKALVTHDIDVVPSDL